MSYSAEVRMDYMLFSGKSTTKETRCWKPLARCPLTNKMMFGKKCTKIVNVIIERVNVVYVDTDSYAYELTIREPWSDIPVPAAFYALGRVGPRSAY